MTTIASIIMLTYIVSAHILFVIFCRYRTGYSDGEWISIITPGMNTIITDDFDESLQRISYWRKNHKVVPFAQPFRSPIEKNIIPMWQKDLARWTNRKEFFFSIDFKDYEPRKGFKCSNYFNK